jgi:2-polyprenylphenol 6-hydroxylase
MSRDFDVVIAGAGVIGTVMASLLLARKLSSAGKVALITGRATPEALPGSAAGAATAAGAAAAAEADWGLRVFALSRASQRLLRLCGVWQALPASRVFAYERMCVWDAAGTPQGAGSLSFDCAEIGEPNLGFIVEGRALQEGCLHAARAAGVVIIETGVRQIDANDNETRIGLTDGRELGARLLIAADGTDSKTRSLLGIGTAGHAYHQDALVAHVRTGKSHRNTAWQRFLPTGPLAFLPLPDGRSSIVWSAARAEAARLRELDATTFAAALNSASDGVLGDIELTTPVASFALKLQYAVDYVKPRAVLLGDAAHVVHPLAGQGLNMGLLDCASLADVFRSAAVPVEFGEHRLLRLYERWRKSENLLAATALDGLERLFANPNSGVARLRAAGLDAVGKLPFIKRQFALRALGLAGDVPAFLKVDAV